jgi:hypothetical protein
MLRCSGRENDEFPEVERLSASTRSWYLITIRIEYLTKGVGQNGLGTEQVFRVGSLTDQSSVASPGLECGIHYDARMLRIEQWSLRLWSNVPTDVIWQFWDSWESGVWPELTSKSGE